MTIRWKYHHWRAEKLIAKALNGTEEQASSIVHKAAVHETRAWTHAFCASGVAADVVGKLAVNGMMLWLQTGRTDKAEQFAAIVLQWHQKSKRLSPLTIDQVNWLRQFGHEYDYLQYLVDFRVENFRLRNNFTDPKRICMDV
jgi:hypothetical protein